MINLQLFIFSLFSKFHVKQVLFQLTSTIKYLCKNFKYGIQNTNPAY